MPNCNIKMDLSTAAKFMEQVEKLRHDRGVLIFATGELNE